MKKFKAKNYKKRKFKVKPFFIFFFIISYIFTFVYFYDNEKFKKNFTFKDINFIKFNLLKFIDAKINNAVSSPKNFLNRDIKSTLNLNTKSNEIYKKVVYNNLKVDNNEKKEYNPIIYVYNTHQLEKYTDYSVFDAAKYLSNKLNDNNIESLFEQKSISDFLSINNLKYYKSYTVSKKYLNEAKEEYNNLSYFFDVHRDSVNKNISTLDYNNTKYAKVLFIVGLDNLNYESNLSNSIKLNDIINNKVPGISRGILKKQGKGVDGIYNQDISSNLFLIEIGGVDNNKDEVIRTVDVIYESIKEYINGI